LEEINTPLPEPLEEIDTSLLGIEKKEPPPERIKKIFREVFTKKSPLVRVGPQEWEKYVGNVGPVPPLPKNIEAILNRRCPFFKDGNNNSLQVRDTHLLVLVPGSVDKVHLTLKTFQNFIQHPKQGNYPTNYNGYSKRVEEQVGNTPFGPSRWVLITRDNIPKSLGMTYEDRQKLISRYASQGYVMPSVQQVVVSICMFYVCNGKPSFRCYPTEPPAITTEAKGQSVYTCCSNTIPISAAEEGEYGSSTAKTTHVIVGGFTDYGVNISRSLFPSHMFEGCAALLPL
jgi:hypothetical protein